jgi:hypothetical protein
VDEAVGLCKASGDLKRRGTIDQGLAISPLDFSALLSRRDPRWADDPNAGEEFECAGQLSPGEDVPEP